MRRVSARFCAMVLLCGAATCQTAEKPEFLVADVHVSPPTNIRAVRGPFFTLGRYELRFATMLDMIRIAYGVEPERVAGGPNWLEWDRFDVFAKTPEKSNAEGRRLMLRSLLEDRFKLTVHNDSRPVPAYGLTAKGPHLKEAESEGDSGCKFTLENASPGSNQLPVINYACRNVTMEAFAQALVNAPGANQYLTNRLVVNQTELKGAYDFTLRYTPKIPASLNFNGTQMPLFEALEKQLGLKLDLTTAPMASIVVDSVNRTPTENSAAAMKDFPPLPTEFEVASLKPSAPNAPQGHPDIKNGRLYVPGITLQNLITVVWDLRGPDFVMNAPKWLDEDKYDILAKAPEGVAIGDLTPNRNTVPVNIDALRPMLKGLIVERFQLAAHTEERPMDTFTLSANKPKMKKADSSERTKWMEGPAPDSKGDKNANPAFGRMVTCTNVTMAQFAEMLPNIAGGYVRTKVLDETGLEGGYDFTFSFSPIGALRQAQRARPPADRPAGAETALEDPDPGAAISLQDALSRQLGLKLETVKRPVEVLVIDKVQRKPIDN